MEFLMVLFTVEFWKGFLGLLLIGIIAYFLIDWIVSKYKTKKRKEKKKDLKEEIAFLHDIAQDWEEEIQKEYLKIEKVSAHQIKKIDELYESISSMKEFVDNCHRNLEEKEKELSILDEKIRGRK